MKEAESGGATPEGQDLLWSVFEDEEATCQGIQETSRNWEK